MKHLTFILAIIVCFVAQAQVPEAFKFQAVIHGSDGTLLTNRSISVRISILRSTITGSAVYSETHAANTNSNGVVNLAIGNGSNQTGNFSNIDWSADHYFVKTEMDPTGGSSYVDIGTSQLLSVPYALQAKAAAGWKPWDVVPGSSIIKGRVGIFNNNPSQELDVTGNIGASGVVLSKSLNVNGVLVTENLHNLGIDKETPQYKLDVGGAVNAAGFLVNGVPLTVNPWTRNGNLIYSKDKVAIGSESQQTPSGLTIEVPVPGSSNHSNGFFMQAYDVNHVGIPMWLRTNTSGLNFGLGDGQTQGRILRLHDERYDFNGIWDIGIGQLNNFFIQQGTGPKALAIANGGNVGIGKENPQYKLDVDGPVNASGFLVNGVPLTPGSSSSQWLTNGNDISYTQGHVNIGTTAPITPSGLYVDVPTPTAQNHANGIFLQANDVVSDGFPMWIRSNTSSLTYGWDEGQTLGRLLRLQDAKYGFDAIWDFGIDTQRSLFINGGDDNFTRKFTITPDGKVGIGTETPHAKMEVTGGDLYINNNTSGFTGVVLKSPAGSCFRVTVSDTGQLVSTSVPCPN